ncbi:MAG: alpha/beta hydrolase [Desulfobacula sp.]|jgi:pimeloyl-ACP methyl ester carboxylesterase|nr:alpha/beta hydrolase [Desulfobacula sp.]
MSAGIILVHGYTGLAKDLMPLSKRLSDHYGAKRVVNLSLPFHDNDQIPEFNQQAFVKEISRAANIFLAKEQKIIFIGHSTGGILILSYILKHTITPDLLVLAGVPRKITVEYLKRWENHSAGNQRLTFASVARMVSLINSMGKKRFDGDFPVLIMNGEKDDLVPKTEAFKWGNNFKGEKRIVIVPDSGHHFFNEKMTADVFSDVIVRALSDVYNSVQTDPPNVLARLTEIEPEAKIFLQKSPSSGYHLSGCPGGKRIIHAEPEYPKSAVTEPVFANIEITTHCN